MDTWEVSQQVFGLQLFGELFVDPLFCLCACPAESFSTSLILRRDSGYLLV